MTERPEVNLDLDPQYVGGRVIRGQEVLAFQLLRKFDVSGVSGTGIVADGWWWPQHEVAILSWRGDWPTLNVHFLGLESVRAIHAHGGATVVTWVDEVPPTAILALLPNVLALKSQFQPHHAARGEQ